MLRKTTELYQLTYDEAKSADRERDRAAWRRGGELFMLRINYRWSSIVLEERNLDLGDKEKRKSLAEEMKIRSYGGYQGELCAGDRASEAPGLIISTSSDPLKRTGEETSLFKLLSFLKHSVIIFAPSSERHTVDEILLTTGKLPTSTETVQVILVTQANTDGAVDETKQGVAYALIDRDGHAHGGYFVKAGELTIVIIRPDGYVGAVVKDKDGVERYFGRIFGH